MKQYAVIMAGGRGERFWPAGRYAVPKQLLPLGGGNRTMIEDTVQRLFPLFAPENIIVATSEIYAQTMKKMLPLPPENIISEPARRNTAGCIALAASFIKNREKDADVTVTVLPADHMITPVTAFHDTLTKAAEEAKKGGIVTIGVIPSRPDTAYGYINISDAVSEGVFKVKGFREKPDAVTARKYFLSGRHRWNSGIFVWKLDTIIKKISRYLPDWGEFIAKTSAAEDFNAAVAEHFSAGQSVSIDIGVLEKSGSITCVDASFYWNDLGSWSSLFELETPDEGGNVSRGRNILIDTRNSIVCSDDDTLVGVIGMRDVAVIKSGNGVLVCPLSEEQRVREITQSIAADADLSDFL